MIKLLISANEEATEGMIEEKVKEMQTKLMKMKVSFKQINGLVFSILI